MCEWTVAGTTAGFRRHQRAGEKSCRECKDANNESKRRWAERKCAELGVSSIKRHRWYRYRLTDEDFRALMDSQNGLCAICQKALDRPGDVHVDHDPSCDHAGKGHRSCRECVRGILCCACNNGIAILDMPELLAQALQYLGRPERSSMAA